MDLKINKLRTLAKLLESNASHTMLFFVTISLRVLSEFSKTCYFSTVLALFSLTQWSKCSYIYCRQMARFHCICLSHRGCLIWSKFVKILKQKFYRQTHALFSDKAHCFSQSVRALYGNYIITNGNRTEWSLIWSVIIQVITKFICLSRL